MIKNSTPWDTYIYIYIYIKGDPDSGYIYSWLEGKFRNMGIYSIGIRYGLYSLIPY